MILVGRFSDFGDFGRRKQLVPFICWRFLKPAKDSSNKVYKVFRHKSRANKKQIWESCASLPVLLQPNAQIYLKPGNTGRKKTHSFWGMHLHQISVWNFGSLIHPKTCSGNFFKDPVPLTTFPPINMVQWEMTLWFLGNPFPTSMIMQSWPLPVLNKVATPLTV